MNDMKKYSVGGILVSFLLVFSIFTLLSISEVNAEEVISVNADGYQNTIIIEFENNGSSEIKTIRIWASGEVTFTSFKSEPGWGGGKYSDNKMVIFTGTNTLNPGESVKFGLITNEKINAINWKTLDQNNNDIDKGKISIRALSETSSDFIEEESKEVELAKETGGELYGMKKFIPEQIRVGSDIRLAGNGFNPEQDLKLYLDSTILQSVKTDKQGNFLTTISIPDTHNVGTSEFIIKDESENIQTTNISVGEAKNRFLKTSKFEVTDIPAEIRFDETLTIMGNAYPQSAIILAFENIDRVLEKTRVVVANANGEWVFEELIDRAENIGEKYVIIQNNNNKTTKHLDLKSDYSVEMSTSAIRYNEGETAAVTGDSEPNKDTMLWIKDQAGKILYYDVFRSQADGKLNYEFVINDSFVLGTYTVTVKQANGVDSSFFGVGKYPSPGIVVLTEKTNFTLNSKAVLTIIGPPSSKLTIKILDSNDSIKMTDSVTTSSTGKSRYTVDLTGLTSGIYRAVIGSTNIQDSVKFSVGLEPGSGTISLITIKDNYSPGESVLVLGNTGSNARITVTLYDPSGSIASVTETFSDGSGNFSTSEIGIPINPELGLWKITAHSRLDTTSVNVNVSLPTANAIIFQIDSTEFSIGNTIMIKGSAQSDTNSIEIDIINENDEIFVSLQTPITTDDTFSLPWIVPTGTPSGTYTITATDGANSDSIEIFIE